MRILVQDLGVFTHIQPPTNGIRSRGFSIPALLLSAVLLWVGQASAQIWTQLSPAGTLPGVRADATAVYNRTSNSMVLFGGVNATADLNDTWILSSANGLGAPQWTNLIPNNASGSPPVRRGNTAIYDEVNDRLTIFGGDQFGQKLGDAWVLTNATGKAGTPAWVQVSPSGGPPSPRSDTTGVYDARHNIMIVSGGTTNFGQPANDTWVLTNANGLAGTPQWKQLQPTGGPPPGPWFRATVYDQASNRMTVFGGGICCGPPYYNDVWVLTGANGLEATSQWVQLSPTGTAPAPRLGATAVYDFPSNRMIIFGGQVDSGTQVNGVWVLTHANGLGGTPAWFHMALTGALPRPTGGNASQATMTYDQRHDRITIFGGSTPTTFLNDTWVLQAQPLTASPNALTFGNQTVGTPSAPMTITLTNAGPWTVSSLGFAVAGADSGDFAQSSDCGTSLNVGATCTVTVTFTPGATGSRSAFINVTAKTYVDRGLIPLSGTGI